MFREDFEILKNDLIYFDNNATSFKPKQVLKAIEDYYNKYTANAHRGDYKNSLKVDMIYEDTRNLIKNYINAKQKEEIIFTSGATDSLNMIASFFKEILNKTIAKTQKM